MRITYNDKMNKLLNPYLESLLKEKTSLEPETLTLFDMFMEDLDMGGRYGIFSEILEPRLEEIIREENKNRRQENKKDRHLVSPACPSPMKKKRKKEPAPGCGPALFI